MTIFNPAINKVGGFTENDGTIDFYARINSLINKNLIVLDYGSGRGGWENDSCSYRKELRNLRGKVKKLYASDIDQAVLLNKNVDQALVMKGNKVDVEDAFFDLVITDYVLEHIQDPYAFSKEVNRILKPGGWFCARTPHKYSLISISARIIKNQFHKKFLKYVQPDRLTEDIFPTFYRLNTLKVLTRIFPKYKDMSFIYRTDPSYYFGNKYIFQLQKLFKPLLISPLIGNLFIFKQKQF